MRRRRLWAYVMRLIMPPITPNLTQREGKSFTRFYFALAPPRPSPLLLPPLRRGPLCWPRHWAPANWARNCIRCKFRREPVIQQKGSDDRLEPTPVLVISCCVRSQRDKCGISEKRSAAVQRKDRTFIQTAAGTNGRIHNSWTNRNFLCVAIAHEALLCVCSILVAEVQSNQLMRSLPKDILDLFEK